MFTQIKIEFKKIFLKLKTHVNYHLYLIKRKKLDDILIIDDS